MGIFSLKNKMQYGAGAMGDTITYNLLSIYLLFFLTDVAGIPPVNAGTIIFIATLVNAFSIILIGYLSDHSTFKGGRRRPFMGISIPASLLFTILMFYVIDGPLHIKMIYYVIINILLWVSQATYVVPYAAVAADITRNVNERVSLRSFSRFFMSLGNLIGLVFLVKIVEFLESKEWTVANAWLLAVTVVALVAVISHSVTWWFLKGKEKSPELNQQLNQNGIKQILFDYIDILKLKQMHYVIGIIFSFSASNVFFGSVLVYFMKYNLQLEENSKMIVFVVLSLCGMIMTPLLLKSTYIIGNKKVMLCSFLISAIGMGALGLIGIHSLITLCVAVIIYTIGSSSYWQFINTLMYDIGDAVEQSNGRRREGVFSSSAMVLLRFFTAIFSQLLAFFLYYFQYVPGIETQSRLALTGIEIAFTYIPALFYLLAAFSIILYLKDKRI